MINIYCKRCNETKEVIHLDWDILECKRCNSEIENPYSEIRDIEEYLHNIKNQYGQIQKEIHDMDQELERKNLKEKREYIKSILKGHGVNITPKQKNK